MNEAGSIRFSTIQYNTTVKLLLLGYDVVYGFSTIQYNTTVKRINPSCV